MTERKAIEIWRIGLGAAGRTAQLAELRSWLSEEERQRADRFHGEIFRSDYILAHGALRWALGQSLGILPGAVRFLPGSFREAGRAAIKPALDLPDGGAKPRFNLSHTHGAALIAVAWEGEVGIDIEWQRPMDDLDGMAHAVMSHTERARWMALAGEDRLRAFYNVWTRKESYLKAIGLGLYSSLEDVTVPVSARRMDPSAGDWERVQDRSRRESWTVTDIPIEGEYSASLCFEGEERPSVWVRDLDFGGRDWETRGELRLC